MYKLGTDKITERAVSILRDKIKKDRPKILDIGSGDGSFLKLAGETIPGEYSACDYTDEIIDNSNIKVDVVDLNQESLPYPEHYFDAVSMTEVIEHLENPRKVVREIFKVLAPGGAVVISTPNILNLKSRLRFLFYGFWNLFGPLKIGGNPIESTNGHISPISYFYLAHALKETGFVNISVTIDKVQKTSLYGALLLYPFIKLNSIRQNRRERNKYRTIDSSNIEFVLKMNSFDILLGRTIIVAADKPD